jgi:hypothetical protein
MHTWLEFMEFATNIVINGYKRPAFVIGSRA